jgi:hypothetical protein
MLDLGPRLSLAVLNLALGLLQRIALIQLGVGAAARFDLPDHLAVFMLFTLLDTGVSSVCIHRIFFAVQQLWLYEPKSVRAKDDQRLLVIRYELHTSETRS